MRSLLSPAAGFLLVAAFSAGLRAQTPVPASPSGQPGYTLHVSSRIVLTDVTVNDKHGNPVRGLDRSSFVILDNGRPEQIASFTEHTGEERPAMAVPQGRNVFSNTYLQHPPPVFDVILLDVTTIHILDQMYLAQELDKFVEALPAGEPLAIYTRAGDFVVMMQDFTSDHALLHAAIHKAIPHLQQPGSWAATDLDTLQQMIMFLRQYPGRKDLIWFSGGSNLALLVDATGFPPMVNMQPLYDELETTRIAVYPVDARGLTVAESGGMPYQHMMMEDTAEATGGLAFYNNNGMREIASRIVDSSADFYTLTYSPHEQKFDNKWHKVEVRVEDRSYQLSYRHGYYDDGSGAGAPSAAGRTVLRANGTTTQRRLDLPKEPIIFSTSVLPSSAAAPGLNVPSGSGALLAPPKKNETTYNIHYALPAKEFVQQSVQGEQRVTIGIGVLGVTRLGARVARKVDTASIGIDPEKYRDHPDGVIGFDEQINLPKGEDFLYIVVWDQASGRFGSVQVPLVVPKPAS